MQDLLLLVGRILIYYSNFVVSLISIKLTKKFLNDALLLNFVIKKKKIIVILKVIQTKRSVQGTCLILSLRQIGHWEV